MGGSTLPLVLLLASWPSRVQTAIYYRDEAEWTAALPGATITNLVWPASDIGTRVSTVDQHQDQGIHWSLQGDSGTFVTSMNNLQLPYLYTSTQVGNGFTQCYRIDFVDPSDGSARPVQALAFNVMSGIALSAAFLRIKDASNQYISMTPAAGGTATGTLAGIGFFGVIAEPGEGLYGMISGSTAAHSSRGDAVRYSLLGSATVTSTATTTTTTTLVGGGGATTTTLVGGGGATTTTLVGGGGAVTTTTLVGGGGATTTTVAGGGGATTTVAGGGAGTTAPHASGDPHLSNTLGEHFDVVRTGTHALLHVPRGAGPRRLLLHVDANITGLTGEHCGALYIRQLRLRGSWAAAQNATLIEAGPWPGARPGGKKLMRLALGPLRLGVENRMDRKGFYYLSVWIGGLRHAGVSIGGLLGEDDHTWAASDPSCARHPGRRSARGRAVLRGRGGALEASTELMAWDAQGPGGAADEGGSYMRATLADLPLDATTIM